MQVYAKLVDSDDERWCHTVFKSAIVFFSVFIVFLFFVCLCIYMCVCFCLCLVLCLMDPCGLISNKMMMMMMMMMMMGALKMQDSKMTDYEISGGGGENAGLEYIGQK